MKKDIAKDAASHAAGALIESEPLAQAAKALVKYGPGLLGAAADRRVKRRFTRWMADVAADLNWNPDQVAQTISEHIDEPWAHDTLIETFRHLMDALDEAVIPCLAALSAEYIDGRKVPDRWFRQVGGLLVGMDAQDVNGMIRVVGFIADATPKSEEFHTAVVNVSGQDFNVMWDPGRKEDAHTQRVPEDQRLFGLLINAGLASGGGNDDGTLGVGPTWLSMHRWVPARLQRCFASQPPP